MSGTRKSALIDLADKVDEALALIACGRVHLAREKLESALLFASLDAREAGEKEQISRTNVRRGFS